SKQAKVFTNEDIKKFKNYKQDDKATQTNTAVSKEQTADSDPATDDNSAEMPKLYKQRARELQAKCDSARRELANIQKETPPKDAYAGHDWNEWNPQVHNCIGHNCVANVDVKFGAPKL